MAQYEHPENKRFISVEECITSAQMALGQTDDGYRNIFREWVYQAQRAIGLSSIINVKDMELDVVDFAFDKPCDMVKPINIRLKDSSGTAIYPHYDWAFMDNAGITNMSLGNKISLSENDEQFVISSNASGYNKADIKYYALSLDDNGLPLIPEYNQRAIVAYIEWMYVKRERRRRANIRDIPLSEVDWYYNQWLRLKADAIGNKNMPSILKAEEVVRKWVTLLPNTRLLSKNRNAMYSVTGILSV